jgi:hypothetical protein
MANRHAGLASAATAVRLVMLVTPLRRMTNFASPLRIVTSSSLIWTTSPTMPLEVTIFVAALQRGEQLFVLLLLAALRADQQKVEDRDEQGDLDDERAHTRTALARRSEQRQ